MKLVISPSKLEKWRYHFRYPDTVTFKDLVDYLEGKQTYTQKATAGTAYHELLENGCGQYWNDVERKYIVPFPDINRFHAFEQSEILPVLQFRKSYPHITHEKKLYHTLHIGRYEILIPMRIDGLNGIVCHDHKYIVRLDPDIEGYMDSYQWKIYLMATGCKVFQYNLFWQQPEDPEAMGEPRKIRWLPFYLYPYQQMFQDIHNGYSQFINFLIESDLLDLVKSKY